MTATAEIKISVAAYNEVANALDGLGKKFAPGTPITIEADVKIVNPIDWRSVNVRKDAAEIAAKVYAESNESGEQTSDNFVRFAEEVFQFMLKGTVPEAKGKIAPKKIPPKRTEPLQSPTKTPATVWGKPTIPHAS